MAAQYTEINRFEFSDFISALGFKPISFSLHETEDIYQKVIERNGKSFSIVVYSSVFRDKSRDVGKDAIRVALFLNTVGGGLIRLSGARRVNRTQGWRENLIKRIERWDEDLVLCPKCSSPMVQRVNKTSKQKFMGCVSFPNCKGTLPC